MKVFRGLDSFSSLQNTVITNGTFDGVHLGHQKVLGSMVSFAKANQLTSVVITFWPHPRVVLQKTDNLELLTTIEERIQFLEETGIDVLVIIPFTKEFGELSAEDYLQKVILQKFNPKKIIIGHDHKFGKNRNGDINYLRQFSSPDTFEVEEIPAHTLDEISVSSTTTRHALKEGKIKDTTAYLGRYYSICGTIGSGNQLGRKIGFRTANIQVDNKHKLIPKSGVYAVSVEVKGKKYNGMLNIGFRPTVDTMNQQTIEVHLFDFSEDIYNESVVVSFIERVRDEKKFDSLELLKDQLAVDKKEIQELLNTNYEKL